MRLLSHQPDIVTLTSGWNRGRFSSLRISKPFSSNLLTHSVLTKAITTPYQLPFGVTSRCAKPLPESSADKQQACIQHHLMLAHKAYICLGTFRHKTAVMVLGFQRRTNSNLVLLTLHLTLTSASLAFLCMSCCSCSSCLKHTGTGILNLRVAAWGQRDPRGSEQDKSGQNKPSV